MITSPDSRSTVLADKNRHLQFILESITSGHFILDADWRFIDINQEAADFLERPLDDLLGNNIWDVFPEAVGKTFYQGYHQALAEKRDVHFDARSVTTGRWFETHVYPFGDRLDVYFREITDRKRMEAAIAESEARYRTLFTSISEGFCLAELITDEQGEPVDFRFLDLNPVTEQIIGMAASDVIQKTAREVFPHIEARWIQAFGQVALTGQPIHVRDYNPRLMKWFDSFVYPVSERRFAVLFMDVTEQEQTQKALQESEQRFRVAQEVSLDGFIVFDSVRDDNQTIIDFLCTYANPAAARMVGHTPADLIGQRLLHVMSDLSEIRAIFERCVQVVETGAPSDVELKYDDTRLHGWFRSMTIKVEDGVAISVTDITARKRAEQRLQKLEEVAAALTAALTPTEVTDVIIHQGLEALGATAGSVAMLSDDKTMMELVNSIGYSNDVIDAWKKFPVKGTRAPLPVAVDTKKPLFLRFRGERDRFMSDYEGRPMDTRHEAWAALPLMVNQEVIGALGLSFPTPRAFDDEEQRFMMALADHCAQAIERARLYDTLQQERDRLRTILDSMTDEVLVVDAEGRFVLANPSASNGLGMDPTHLSLQKWISMLEVYTPDGHLRPASEAPLFRSLAGETLENVEEVVRHFQTSELRYRQLNTSPLIDDGGQIIGAVAVGRDMTQQKQAEQQLRYQAMLLENISDAVVATDLEMRIQSWNPAAEATYGWTAEEVLGKRGVEIFQSSFLGSARDEIIQKLLRDGQWKGEAVRTCKNGASIEVLVSTVLLHDNAGRPIGYVIVDRDISDQKRVEAAEHEQRMLAEAMLDITVTINSSLNLAEVLDSILEGVNQVVPHDASAVFFVEEGVAKAQRTRGLGPDILVAGEKLQFQIANTPALQEMFQNRTTLLVPDISVYTGWIRDEGRLHVHFRGFVGAPIILNEEIIGFLLLYSLTPHFFGRVHADHLRLFAGTVATAIQNARLYEQAQEAAAVRERERLARDLHDAVSQALFSANVIAESLPRSWGRDPNKTLKRLEQLHQLTRGAQAEMRTLLLELRPAALLEAELETLLPQLVEATRSRRMFDITVDVTVSHPLPPDIKISFYRIAQEALNNVAKHSAATKASIHFRSDERHAELMIVDNGRGFDPEQVSATSLGMNIMRERAEAIGAALNVSTEPNKGTRINVKWIAVKMPTL